MRLLEVTRLLATGLLWKAAGIQSAGQRIVSALGSDDENVRTIAGMLLVKAGKRSEPLLEAALQKRENLPMVLSILADIGDRRFESDLQAFSRDQDPQVSKAAKEALRVLAAHQ